MVISNDSVFYIRGTFINIFSILVEVELLVKKFVLGSNATVPMSASIKIINTLRIINIRV